MNSNNGRRLTSSQSLVPAGNHESVTFIWFDPDDSSNANLAGPLRAINDQVQIFTHLSSCLDFLHSSPMKIFFITSSADSEFLNTVHQSSNVEGIAVLHSNLESVKGDLPKLVGVFRQQEELLRVLKDLLEIFEQVQLETFAFEEEKVFLWSQLHREEINNRKLRAKKSAFVETTRQTYADNGRILGAIEEFDKTYRPNEVLSWCFRSPYPSRFLHHALRSHQKEQLRVCHLLLIDAAHRFQQQPKCKGTDQVYRGMKLSRELLDQFESHAGHCLTTSAFFPCTKSRSQALTFASLSNFRPDLFPVLFKIDCDPSAVCIELSNRQSVLELSTVFRIVYVNRGPMSVIKMKTDNQVGKKLVENYLEENKEKSIQALLDELIRPPTPPPIEVKSVTISAEERQAEKHLEDGNVDLALIAYHRLQPVTARILNAIGRLCAEKKGDYNYALQCHSRALKMQEEAKEELTETLTDLGKVHQHRKESEQALSCHRRALGLRQKKRSVNRAAVVSNLLGIANAHWTRLEYPQAIDSCEQALTLQESLVPIDESSLGTTLAMLGNIHHETGQDVRALDYYRRALDLRERTLSKDSPVLAEFLHQLGTIQLRLEQFSSAQQSYERALNIYQRILPRGHPDRLAVETDLRRVNEVRNDK